MKRLLLFAAMLAMLASCEKEQAIEDQPLTDAEEIIAKNPHLSEAAKDWFRTKRSSGSSLPALGIVLSQTAKKRFIHLYNPNGGDIPIGNIRKSFSWKPLLDGNVPPTYTAADGYEYWIGMIGSHPNDWGCIGGALAYTINAVSSPPTDTDYMVVTNNQRLQFKLRCPWSGTVPPSEQYAKVRLWEQFTQLENYWTDNMNCGQ